MKDGQVFGDLPGSALTWTGSTLLVREQLGLWTIGGRELPAAGGLRFDLGDVQVVFQDQQATSFTLQPSEIPGARLMFMMAAAILLSASVHTLSGIMWADPDLRSDLRAILVPLVPEQAAPTADERSQRAPASIDYNWRPPVSVQFEESDTDTPAG